MRRSLAIACLALPSLTPILAQTGPGSACTMRETARAPLVVDGAREMYVEPMVVQPSGSDVLLVGSPNYLFQPGKAGDPRDFVRDSVFGAILDAGGRGRLVPAPPSIDPKRVTALRGATLPNGNWAVVFAQTRRPAEFGVPDTIVGWWHAIHDGRSWTRVEPLPGFANTTLLTSGFSNLIVRGDTTFFAARIVTESGGQHAALFQRREGRWTVTVVPAYRTTYVQLGYSDRDGLVLAIVRPQPTGTEWDMNSLFVHRHGTPWAGARRLVIGGTEPVHAPVFTNSADGMSLTWQVHTSAGRVGRAAVGSLLNDATPMTVDSGVSHIVAVAHRAGPHAWISERVRGPGSLELQFSTLSRGGLVEVSRTPSPFTGPFLATAPSPTDLLISGPLLRREPPNPSLVSLIIRLRVDCAAGAPPPDGWTLARRVYVHPPTGGLNDSIPAIHRALRERADPARLRERHRPHVPAPF